MKDTILKVLTAVTLILTLGIVIYENESNPQTGEIEYIDEFQIVYADDSEESTAHTDEETEEETKDRASDYEILHVYEDGCKDVREPIDGEVRFVCDGVWYDEVQPLD